MVENSQRVDVHPYEEAQGFQQLLDMPGYDVAALVEKSGKSPSHIYARLSLLQLILSIAKAFTQERITVSHANLLARLPRNVQALAYEQCWRKDWQDKEPHLLPAKNLSAWIQANLYLALAEAPFDREDPTLNPVAGACGQCPRRSGYNTTLFSDVSSDECLDAPCFQTKVQAHIDREVAARPELIQIENGYRSPREKKPGAVPRGRFHEIAGIDATSHPNAEPVASCQAAKPAIIVFGKRAGSTLTVCTDEFCPVHHPSAAARQAEPAAIIVPAAPAETEEEAEARTQQQEQQQKEKAERERREEEDRLEHECKAQEYQAEQTRRNEQRKARAATFERILENAPTTFNAAQLRVLLRALVNLDSYTFAGDIADENDQRGSEEVLLTAIDATADDTLTRFALRLALSGHVGIPRRGEFDFLMEAEAVFCPQPTPVRKPKSRKAKSVLVKAAAKKTGPAKKKTAA